VAYWIEVVYNRRRRHWSPRDGQPHRLREPHQPNHQQKRNSYLTTR